MRRILFWTFVVLVVAVAGFFVIGPDRVYTALAGPADMGPVDFETLRKTPKPNQALACPADFCKNEKADIVPPVYDLPANELAQALLSAVSNEERLERVDDGGTENKLRFVQRSSIMRYPDTIRVEIIPLTSTSSTLAIYSQSQLGRSDFGVNHARIKRWLKKLDATVAAA